MKPDNNSHDLLTTHLMDRVVIILEQARKSVVRSIDHNMLIAYWSIGREIVFSMQQGENRAKYGKQIIEELSNKLNRKYGRGFSTTNLWYFRKFYQTYPNRVRDEKKEFCSQDSSFEGTGVKNGGREILHKPCGESEVPNNQLEKNQFEGPFLPNLTWSHYRTLLKVNDQKIRCFYEQEASECGWTLGQLERQIQTSYYERIVANKGEEGLIKSRHKRLPGKELSPDSVLKSPYVLEFLGLPDSAPLHETDLESAIISNLELFLLELGRGFSFVARQKMIRFDEDQFYVDLVFYNFLLKCFVLIDLKIGKLSHQDIGQMDGYVRLFEDQFKVEGDNPTIGLILCSTKTEAVAKYSILAEGRQIFASQYLQYLPSEDELKKIIENKRKILEGDNS